MPQFNIQYFVGVDGLSLFLVLLTTLITVLVLIFSWEGVEQAAARPTCSCMLLLEAGMIGVFVSLDLVLFYVFWELTLIPMYFLIGGWGDPHGTYTFLGRTMPWRIYAALKFFLYTLAGSALMLVAILVLYAQGGTFDLLRAAEACSLAPNLQIVALPGVCAGVRHQGADLPVPHLAARRARRGADRRLGDPGRRPAEDGHLRLRALLPAALPRRHAARSRRGSPRSRIIGILYGALVALVQKDVKSLVAYSSVAHLGFVMLGIFALNAQGIAGATLQMVNHGLSTGALFLMVGMLYNRRHTRLLADFGGLWKQIPIYGFLFIIVALSSVGPAGAERLRRRVQHPARRVPDQPGLRRLRHARHHPGRLVPALGHPPDAARARSPSRRTQQSARPEAARGAHAGAARSSCSS